MKTIIKNSIDKIELGNSRKKEIYSKIINKKRSNVNYILKYACVCIIMVFWLFIVDNNKNNNEHIMLSRSMYIEVNGEFYEPVGAPYELGDKLDRVIIGDVTYEVYENKLDSNTIILFNEFYEVYVKKEG